MKKYIIALDQGTTSSRALIFDKNQQIVALAQREFSQIYPQAGWVEHHPKEILDTQLAVLQEAVVKAGIRAEEIAAIGITNQRETTVLWDKATGEPIYNAIVWQCRRTAPLCDQLRADGLEDYIRSATGLLADAYFSGTKIRWILDNVPGARKRAEKGEILFGTIDSWLVWNLTGGKVHITDATNASRTMLFNIKTLRWDEKILEALRIPANILPEVRDSSEIYGETDFSSGNAFIRNLSPRLNLSPLSGIPIAGIAGDQQAALFGQGAFQPGDAKNTYGTGCFLLMNTGDTPVFSQRGLLTTIGVALGGKIEYALEGSIFVGGAVIQWLRDELHLIERASETNEIASQIPDNGGVYIVPAFVGLGAPYWDMYARGAIFGLTRGSGRPHLIRAALESIAYQTRDVLDAMEEETGGALQTLYADGGAINNPFLAQFQADILGKRVVRPQMTETTALGAASLAGLAVGFWKNRQELIADRPQGTEFIPRLAEADRKRFYQGWKKAVRRVRDWDKE